MKTQDGPLREAERLYRTVLSNISDAVFITDMQGRFTFVCPNAHVIFGHTEDEVIQMGHINRLLGDDVYDLQELDRHGELTNIERHVVDKSGRDHALLINVKQVEIGDGRLLYTCRDATRRLHHEKMLLKYQKRLRSLAAALSMAEERERRKLATALHDVIGQELVATSMKLQSLRPAVSDDHHATLDEATELLSRAIRNSRDLTFEISPPVLYELGLVAALEWLGERYARQYDLSIEFQASGPADELSDELKVALFQSARELLNNVTRHARASTVDIQLTCQADKVALMVSDDGVGFDDHTTTSAAHEPQGYGLFSIRERLGHLGGRLDIRSQSGKGTQVLLELPREMIQAQDREANHEYPDRVG